MGLGFEGLGLKVYYIKVTLCGEGIVMIHPKFAAVEMSVGQSELISGLNRNRLGVIPASSRRTVSDDEMSVDVLVACNKFRILQRIWDLNDVQCRSLAKHVAAMNRIGPAASSSAPRSQCRGRLWQRILLQPYFCSPCSSITVCQAPWVAHQRLHMVVSHNKGNPI